MPQMSPLTWVTLYLSFSIILLVMITKSYFSLPCSSSASKSLTPQSHNKPHWMW